jgi:hypothetical protein
VLGLSWTFGFCLIEDKSQTKRAGSQKHLFSKSRLSRSAKLKSSLDLLLAVFGWNCEKYMEQFLAAFSGFHQNIFNFLAVHRPQQLFSQLIDHNSCFHSHSPTKQTPNIRRGAGMSKCQ